MYKVLTVFTVSTEADIAKMDVINALDSSAPQPPKQRVRTPRAKPPAKVDPPVQEGDQKDGKDEEKEEKAAAETPTKTSQHSPRKTLVTTYPALSQEEMTKEQRLAMLTLTSSPQVLSTPCNEKNDEIVSESKKNKKRKETVENKVDKNAAEPGEDEKENESNERKGKSVEKKKRRNTITGMEGGSRTVEDRAEVMKTNGSRDFDNEESAESTVRLKKHKKKKKEKGEKKSEQTAELVAVDDTEQGCEEKKVKKKKSKKKGDKETETSEQMVEGEMGEREKRGETEGEESSEHVVKEKKKKKEKKDKAEKMAVEEEGKTSEQTVVEDTTEEQTEQTPKVKKKKRLLSLNSTFVDTDVLLPHIHETPCPPTEKKKSKLTNHFDPD